MNEKSNYRLIKQLIDLTIIEPYPLTQHQIIPYYLVLNKPFDPALNHPLLPSIEPSVPPKVDVFLGRKNLLHL